MKGGFSNVLESFTYSTFIDQLGKSFRVLLDTDKALEVKLVQVVELSNQRSSSTDTEPSPHDGESFSLLFHGPRERFLPQGTYQFDHDGIGRFPIFIVPIGDENGGFQYQAVFNRLPC